VAAALAAGLVVAVLGGLAVGGALAAGGPAGAPARARAASAAEAGPAVPPGWAARRREAGLRTGRPASPATAAVAGLLDPVWPGCGPTRLTRWVATLLHGLTRPQLDFVLRSGILDFPADDAALTARAANPAAPTGPGAPGLVRAARAAGSFWGTGPDDVRLVAAHGDVLRDPVRLTRLLAVVYRLPPAQAQRYASEVVAAVAGIPALRHGDNPVLTLGAAPLPARPSAAGPLATVVVGDGALAYLAATGVADVAPAVLVADAVARRVADDLPAPAAAASAGVQAERRQALLGLALGTHFATSRRGLALDAWRVLQTTGALGELGDCPADTGLRGTPDQRLRAATWGADLAARRPASASAPRLAARFDAALPAVLSPPVAPAAGLAPTG